MGVDPIDGANSIMRAIAELYLLDLTFVNKIVDPTFNFMTLDWDPQIRIDQSSLYFMVRLMGIKDRFDISHASHTDITSTWNRHEKH